MSSIKSVLPLNCKAWCQSFAAGNKVHRLNLTKQTQVINFEIIYSVIIHNQTARSQSEITLGKLKLFGLLAIWEVGT